MYIGIVGVSLVFRPVSRPFLFHSKKKFGKNILQLFHGKQSLFQWR